MTLNDTFLIIENLKRPHAIGTLSMNLKSLSKPLSPAVSKAIFKAYIAYIATIILLMVYLFIFNMNGLSVFFRYFAIPAISVGIIISIFFPTVFFPASRQSNPDQ